MSVAGYCLALRFLVPLPASGRNCQNVTRSVTLGAGSHYADGGLPIFALTAIIDAGELVAAKNLARNLLCSTPHGARCLGNPLQSSIQYL